jgi:hypothetical protein
MTINFSVTENKPFSFFEDLIFYDSIEQVLKLFYDESIITENYHLVVERNSEFVFENWVGKNDLSDMIGYDKHFKLILTYFSKIGFDGLQKHIDNADESLNKKFIKSQLNLLAACIEKNKFGVINEYNELIQVELFNIISSIKFKYSYLVPSHKAFIQIVDNLNNINSIFQPKPEIKRTFFKKLHSLLIDLDLIDDIVVSEVVFLDVMTSVKPHLDSKIIFTKTNPIIACLLKEVEPFFNNFNAVSIEKSQCFFNKQNKVLKSNDLYTALSRSSSSNHDYFIRIKKKIGELENIYLK